ncbi:MAG: hypothetical protein A2Z66_05130, partial [Chloroflexi bacterium RBG_13_66_10]
IGRVTRSSTRGFVGAVRLPEPEIPVFGAFCLADAQRGQSAVIGLIYDISIEDDAFARQMATSEGLAPEQLADARFNRQVPVEFSALAVGFRLPGGFRYSLPPQPPLTMAPIHPLASAEIRSFTDRPEWIPLVLGAAEIPADDLLAASLRLAAEARPDAERLPFLVAAGRECARLLSHDLSRLDNLLRTLQA